jgi:hypothetical protein
MGSQPQKTQKSPKSFQHIPFCRTFTLIILLKKSFLISSTNDGARVKILKNVKSSSNLTFLSVLSLASSFVDKSRKLFLIKMISVKSSTKWHMFKRFWRLLCFL